MAGKTQERRAQLRETLLDLAEIRIAAEGVNNLRARDLAKDANCSVGAIYNVFEDMTALVMAVNGRTFTRIGQDVAKVVDPSLDPAQQLIRLSFAYLGFARENTAAWRALFDLEMTSKQDVPVWYMNALDGLFELINEPVSRLFPDYDASGVDLMTRTLFSAVHGIVLLGLEHRVSAVPEEQIETMISKLLGSLK